MSASAAPSSKKPSKQGAQELPVFCVSAKDCQRLEGRTSKDGPPSAFTKLEFTEMPQLRQHVHHVTGKLAFGLTLIHAHTLTCILTRLRNRWRT